MRDAEHLGDVAKGNIVVDELAGCCAGQLSDESFKGADLGAELLDELTNCAHVHAVGIDRNDVDFNLGEG